MQNSILIVDNEFEKLSILIDNLQDFGYNYGFVRSSEELMTRLGEELFDLLLIQTELSGTDGITALQTVKSHPVFYDLPVVMLAEHPNDLMIENCFAYGADDLIVLPIEKYMLRARIKSVFEKLGFVRKIQLQKDELKMQRNIARQQKLNLEKSENKLQALINTSHSGIAVANIKAEFTFANAVFCRMFGYTEQEMLKMNHFHLIPSKNYTEVQQRYQSLVVGENDFLEKIRLYVKKDGTTFWGHITVSVIHNSDGLPESIVSFLTDINDLKQSQIQISKAHKNIKAGITYAKRIQNALLPSMRMVNRILPECFVFYSPKDVVSGDFYWTKQINETILIAAADCTGHGVPGAFMSLLFISMLNELTGKKNFQNPGLLLDEIRSQLNNIFSDSESDKKDAIQDGMDIGLCMYNLNNGKLQFAGAFNSLIYFRNDELIEVKGDSMPIGAWRNNSNFKNNEIIVNNSDMFYIFSDGFYDQIGGSENRKFMKGNFRRLLKSTYKLSITEQSETISQTFEQWKGDYEQVDDILVIGFKCPKNTEIPLNEKESYIWNDKTILIAEDEPESYKLLKEMLRKTHANIIWAKNGAEAIEICRVQEIDLLLTDIMMPVISGIEAIETIREFNKTLPIVIETALVEREDKARSFQAGCTDYVTKPINTRELLATLSKYI